MVTSGRSKRVRALGLPAPHERLEVCGGPLVGASGFNPYVRFLPDSRRSGLGAMMSASGPGRRSTCKMST